MDYSKYAIYTLQDFLDDDSFVSWLTAPNAEKDYFWQSFLKLHPEKLVLVEQASQIIKTYAQQDTFFNAENQSAVWQRIEASIATKNLSRKKVFSISPLWRVAAVLFLLISVGAAFWFLNRKEVISTKFGEIRTITLPDQSVVVLNSNSQLSYYKVWGAHSREVWINGEALFNVKHLNQDSLHIKPFERFSVHCNTVNVEVLGTTFNVKNRHEKVDISLLHGKIKVDNTNPNLPQPESRVMKPGDYVQFEHNLLVSKKALTKPTTVTSWTQHRLIFNNPHLSDISEALQDEYGYQINIDDPALTDLKIEGEINVNNTKELLQIIATTLHLKVLQTDKNITITEFKYPNN